MSKMRARRRGGQDPGTGGRHPGVRAAGCGDQPVLRRDAQDTAASAHVLARHVEGASHMAEGYTRAKAGNIGVCIGTSGPAGTDMITGLYSASRRLDPDPVHHRPGARSPGCTRRTSRPSTSPPSPSRSPSGRSPCWSRRRCPGVFQQAFHLMRSGRPGPVLIDLPFDVQMAEIDFDPDTYTPLPVYKPAATRAQVDKALDMLLAAERPLIVAGGGIINADAARPAGRVRRDPRRAGRPDPDGLGRHPRRPPADGRHGRPADLAPLRQRDPARVGLRAGHRQPVGQPAHRRPGRLPQRPHVRPRRHRADPDRPGVRTRLRHRVRRQGRAGAVRRGGQGARRTTCPTTASGSRTASSASRRCSGGPTSTTCRSSRSASTRR